MVGSKLPRQPENTNSHDTGLPNGLPKRIRLAGKDIDSNPQSPAKQRMPIDPTQTPMHINGHDPMPAVPLDLDGGERGLPIGVPSAAMIALMLLKINFPFVDYGGVMAEHQTWSVRDVIWKIRRSNPCFARGKSAMKGVTVRKGARRDAYDVRIGHTYRGEQQKVTYYLGTFRSEEEAGREYDRVLLFIHHALTEEEQFHVVTNFRPSGYTEAEIMRAGRANTSHGEIRMDTPITEEVEY